MSNLEKKKRIYDVNPVVFNLQYINMYIHIGFKYLKW